MSFIYTASYLDLRKRLLNFKLHSYSLSSLYRYNMYIIRREHLHNLNKYGNKSIIQNILCAHKVRWHHHFCDVATSPTPKLRQNLWNFLFIFVTSMIHKMFYVYVCKVLFCYYFYQELNTELNVWCHSLQMYSVFTGIKHRIECLMLQFTLYLQELNTELNNWCQFTLYLQELNTELNVWYHSLLCIYRN